MIEASLYNYFMADTTITNNVSVYITQAPVDAKMPWLVILPTPTEINRISKNKMEEKDFVRIIVDYPSSDTNGAGRFVAERAKVLVENYRGDMGDTVDLFIGCGGVSSFPGMNGSYRYQFDVNARFTYDRLTPPFV